MAHEKLKNSIEFFKFLQSAALSFLLAYIVFGVLATHTHPSRPLVFDAVDMAIETPLLNIRVTSPETRIDGSDVFYLFLFGFALTIMSFITTALKIEKWRLSRQWRKFKEDNNVG